MPFDYEQFFEHSIDMLCIAGSDGFFKRVNPAFTRALGWSREELLGRPFVDFVHPDDREATIAETARLAAGESSIDFENRYRRPDGSYRYLRWTGALDAGTGLLFAIARDISGDVETVEGLAAHVEELTRRLHKARERLEQVAVTDPLTGTRNRRAFEDSLQTIGRLASRSGGWMSLVILDIDHLKQYNDNFGHKAGDQVLSTLGALLLDTARRSDVVARYGEQEFVILLPDTPASGAMHFAERLVERVRYYNWEHRQVTVGVGVSTVQFVPGETSRLKWNLGKIISDAQRALRFSKNGGRKRRVIHATDVERELAARS